MHVRTTRRPGESGTQKLVAKYGDKLVALRYRYDAAKKKRYKTITNYYPWHFVLHLVRKTMGSTTS